MTLSAQVNDHADLNVSHTIHKLSFGPEFPGEENPLDDFVRTVRKGEPTGTFKYFLKVRCIRLQLRCARTCSDFRSRIFSWCLFSTAA